MMKRFFHPYRLAAVGLLVLMLAATGCRREVRYRIGVSQCSDDDWRAKMNEEILREALFHDDVSVEIRSADDDNERQIADIRHFAAAGFDLIIASPNEAEALTPVIREVYEAGIPVILFDRNIIGDTYTAYQGADNREIGRSAARLARGMADPEARILEIRGLKGSTPAIERSQGFREVADADPDMRMLGAGEGNWGDEAGYRTADSLLERHPETNLIYAHNDRMAIAAARAARRRGRTDIRVIGIDAAPAIGIRAVADSVIDATFLYPTEGHQLLRTAMAILEGQPYERNLILPTASAVDRSNAGILLLQDNALREETQKVEWLKARVDDYLTQHMTQTIALYAVLFVSLLFAGMIFMLLRAYWSHVRQRDMLDAQNRELEHQRDELNRLYEQLQEATRSKLSFFTNVSHELRTPLTLIADPVEQLARAENITDRQRTLMLLADKNVKILKRLINQILDFRKYENGKLALNPTETDLAAAVTEWCGSFRNAALKRHIKLRLSIAQPADYTMAVDLEKFERILFNLLSNAFKFTPANGEVRVGLDTDGSELRLTVADTGSGMSPEDLGHIFDRFFQAERVRANGSGIGLTLVKAFAELHGGGVTVQSEPGKGSCFTVTIPVAHAAPAPDTEHAPLIPESTVTGELTDIEPDLPAAGAEAAPDEKSRTVLIIDDNADIRTLVTGLLCDRYTVLQAAEGSQGIRLASKYSPDLILCDVMMPGIDGLETCRRLKSEITTSHIPVLMLTACSMEEQRIEIYECGADAYLSKPFNARVLTARCEALILNRKRIGDALTADPMATAPRSTAPTPERTAKPAAAGDIDNAFYRRFTALAEKELANPDLSVEEMAAALGLSRVQFYRKIKSLTNYSPAELLRILRLKRADMLLKTTESNVSEISYQVGFSSPSYFTKCYRDYFGEAPTEVQKRTSKIGK